MAKVKWYGDAVGASIEQAIQDRLAACAQIGADHARKLISKDGTTKAQREVAVKDEYGFNKLKRVMTGYEERTIKGRNGKERTIKIRNYGHKIVTRKETYTLEYNTNPSKPGEPPRVQTGRLRASVAWEQDGRVARIGTNVRYGRFLELGTSRMAPRPWLRRMLAEMTPTFRAILTAPIKGGGK